jgi:hypothetical protein
MSGAVQGTRRQERRRGAISADDYMHPVAVATAATGQQRGAGDTGAQQVQLQLAHEVEKRGGGSMHAAEDAARRAAALRRGRRGGAVVLIAGQDSSEVSSHRTAVEGRRPRAAAEQRGRGLPAQQQRQQQQRPTRSGPPDGKALWRQLGAAGRLSTKVELVLPSRNNAGAAGVANQSKSKYRFAVAKQVKLRAEEGVDEVEAELKRRAVRMVGM